MSSRFPCLLLLFLCAACLEDDHPQRTEKWYVETWEASNGCFFLEEGGEEQNQVFETLLGLNDSAMIKTELLLRSDKEMQILKNGELVLSGEWNDVDRRILTLTANGQFWNFEIVNRDAGSILLRGENYRYIDKVDILLRLR